MNTVKVRNIEIGAGIPKICVPIVGVTREEILAAAENIKSTKADVVEWRVDWYEDIFDFAKTEATMQALREVLGEMPILFTFRTSKEGGEKAIETGAYVELNQNAAKTGLIDLVDVEAFTGDEVVKAVVETAHANGVKVIASNHDFHKTPAKEEIVSRLRKMQELGADIPKIAVMPQNKKERCSYTSYSNRRDGKRVCGSSDHYNVYVRNRCDQPSLWRSLWFCTDIWSSWESICTGTDGD